MAVDQAGEHIPPGGVDDRLGLDWGRTRGYGCARRYGRTCGCGRGFGFGGFGFGGFGFGCGFAQPAERPYVPADDADIRSEGRRAGPVDNPATRDQDIEGHEFD
nr:hypothetical protein [Planotetraspora silvatica]